MLKMAPELSVIIPAYNEEKRLPSTLNLLREYFSQSVIIPEIIIVNDGSSDATEQVSQTFKATNPQYSVIVIRHVVNSGKGAAIKSGVQAATGNYILLYDADGATPIQEVSRFWPRRSDSTVLIGSRALTSNEVQLKTRLHRKGLGRLFNLAVNILVLPNLKDTQCGFKLLPSSVAKEIFKKTTLMRFSFDVEMLFLAKTMGLNICEIAINWTDIPGSKISIIKDGIKMFIDLFRIRFRHRGSK